VQAELSLHTTGVYTQPPVTVLSQVSTVHAKLSLHVLLVDKHPVVASHDVNVQVLGGQTIGV